MARNPLTRILQKAFAGAAAAKELSSEAEARQFSQGASAAGSSGHRHDPSPAHTRRRFLYDSSLATGSLLIPGFLKPRFPEKGATASGDRNIPASPFDASAPPSTRIAIVGAGMAGLNAAYHLQRQGIPATVYEASDRVGGRMFTLKY